MSAALGEMEALFGDDLVRLLFTDALELLVEDKSIEWTDCPRYDLLLEIYRFFSSLLLYPGGRIIRVRNITPGDYEPHPLPPGCAGKGLAEFWSDEVGKLLALHDRCSDADGFFIGVACPDAFNNDPPGQYEDASSKRAFPLVGPGQLESLDDAYVRACGDDIHRRSVTFQQAKANCFLLGAVDVEPPSGGGSHYRVIFPGKRPWPLDRNHKVIPERYLRELEETTGYSIEVIKYALINGELPEPRLRLADLDCCLCEAG